jgi:hypothetical protein
MVRSAAFAGSGAAPQLGLRVERPQGVLPACCAKPPPQVNEALVTP